MGERPSGGMAVQLLARGRGREDGRISDDRQDVQGADRRRVRDDDRADAESRDVRGAVGFPCATRGRRRGGAQRDSTEPPLPERVRAPLRPDRSDSGRQRTRGRRHVHAAQAALRETVRTERPRTRRDLIVRSTFAALPRKRPSDSAVYLYLEGWSGARLWSAGPKVRLSSVLVFLALRASERS